MVRSLTVLCLACVFIASSLVLAQDPAKVGPQVYKCIFENERVRVCEVTFKAGERMGAHSHPDHFVYVLSGGKLRITPWGRAPAEADMKTGQVMWIPAETHSAINIGTTEARALVVELKDIGPEEAAILQMERDLANAWLKGDAATVDRIMAKEWLLTNPLGQVQTRADTEAEVRSGVLKFESMVPHDLQVRVIGDTAIVSGVSTDKVTYKGQDMSGDYRFTDVFVKRDGRWQMVSTHVSRLMPE